jgi:flagellar basal-body rod protein FlgF
MDNALLIGLSRQVVLGRELEVVANNLANMNTTGFKSDNSLFEQFMMPEASASAFPTESRDIAYVQDRATWRNMGAGPLLRTGNPLDVAVDGNAFLVVQTAAGQRFTRNGALQIAADGTLVTSTGDPVLGNGGPIQFQTTDHDISIGEDGTITVREGASSTSDAVRGQLQLVQFASPGALQKEGTSLFSDPTGAAGQGAPLSARVVQGAVEQSNVIAVTEMTHMIQVSRAYEDIANILQQENTQRSNALDKLAAVPA